MLRLTGSIKHIIIICVIAFIASQLQMYGEQISVLLALWFPESTNFQLWQIISHMFMHGSIMHLLFNMYALWAFGSPLERMWGTNKFLFFYFSAGIGAALVFSGVNYFYVLQAYESVSEWLPKEVFFELLNLNDPTTNLTEFLSSKGIVSQLNASNMASISEAYNIVHTPAVGASGAIYGVLVAFAFMFPNAELMLIFLPVPIKAKYFVPLIIAADVFFGLSDINTGIAHFAHVGGALIGFIMMWYWKKNQFNDRRWD